MAEGGGRKRKMTKG